MRWAEAGKDKVFNKNVEPSELLFIANFDPFTTSKEVEDLFSKYGHVSRVSLKRNFGFVQFADVKDAIDAVRNLDGSRVNNFKESQSQFTYYFILFFFSSEKEICLLISHRFLKDKNRKRNQE